MDIRDSQKQSIDLSAHANCELVKYDTGNLEFRFPERQGVVKSTRWEFRDRAELVDYVGQLLSLDMRGDGLRGKAVRYGKYDCQGPNGERAFTFGDPILDLITDAEGGIVLGGRRIDLAAIELESPRYRSGGIRQIDLGVVADEVRSFQVAQAASGQGDFTLVECTQDAVALASTNPSQRDFYAGGTHLRFKAWKKNYAVYWSIGAEVETWGHDFDSASIESRYLDTVVAQTCAVVKYDNDSDTNDDYLDEYEWGVNAPQPLRVVSRCTAQWFGQPYGGQVEAGPTFSRSDLAGARTRTKLADP